MNRVSIALCTYNGEKFLSKQLYSFLRQTRLPDELIICDDLSSDTTSDIINNFAQIAPFPVQLYVNDRNLGSTKNFEKAISLCTGELIYLSDQDDVWRPEKIETIEAEFRKNPKVGLVFTNAEMVDENLRPRNERLWSHTFPERERKKALTAEFYKTLLNGNAVTGATAAFSSRFVKDFLPIPTHMPNMIHDGWIALVISVFAEIAFLDKPLIKYRQHSAQQLGGSDTNGTRKERLSKAIKLLRNQKMLTEILTKSLNDYPALRYEGKIERAVKENELELQENIVHLENRLKLFDERLFRLPSILIELRSGRYHRFSHGLLSSVKDIFAG